MAPEADMFVFLLMMYKHIVSPYVIHVLFHFFTATVDRI